MLDVSPKNLWLEIDAAIKFRDSHLGQVDDLVEFYTGNAYRNGGGNWSENHMFEYIRLNTSKIVFDNPKVRIKTGRPTQRMIAKALQHGINRNTRETALRKLLKNIFVSQLFCFEAVITTIEPQPWIDPRTSKTYHWPMSYPLHRSRFFFDPLCMVYGSARYVGHKSVRDKEDVLKEAETDSTWNTDAIEAVSADAGTEDLPERGGGEGRSSLNRKELIYYELWIPERETGDPRKGYNGTLYTVAVGGNKDDPKAEEIREPRPYYGPRWGPYTLYGIYPVPGDPWPLSPFIANFPQMEELNNIVSASNDAIRKYQKLIFVDAGNPDLVKKVTAGQNLFVYPIKGLKPDSIVEKEIAGITPQHVEQMKQALDRMDRNSGISDPARGNVGSRSTATEIAVADEASKGSMSFVQQEFTDATVQMLKTRAWFLYHDDRVNFPLGEDAAMDFEMGEPWFQGGGAGRETEFAFDDLELEIEPFSMERMNEALARAGYREQMELALQAAPLIPVTPFYDWQKLFEKGGEINNDPYFSEFFLPEIARMVGMNGGGQVGGGSVGGVSDGIGSVAPPPTTGQMAGQQQSTLMASVS